MRCIDGNNPYCPFRSNIDRSISYLSISYLFCISENVDVPCDFFSTKETAHIALFIQSVARTAVCLKTKSLLSASLRVTVFRPIFFFVALNASVHFTRPCNSTSTGCHFENVFIINVGRCARSAVRGREHSLTRRPLWYGSRGLDNQCGCGKNTAFNTQRVVCVLWVGDYEKRVLDGVPGQCDVLFVRPRCIGCHGQRIDIYCHPPHEYIDKRSIVKLGACSGCFLLGLQGGAPGFTLSAVPTHGGVVCVVWLCLEQGGRCGCWPRLVEKLFFR